MWLEYILLWIWKLAMGIKVYECHMNYPYLRTYVDSIKLSLFWWTRINIFIFYTYIPYSKSNKCFYNISHSMLLKILIILTWFMFVVPYVKYVVVFEHTYVDFKHQWLWEFFAFVRMYVEIDLIKNIMSICLFV